MNPSQPTPTRKRWLISFAYFAILVFVYRVICVVVERTRQLNAPANPNLQQLRVGMLVLALIALVLSVIWLRVRVDEQLRGSNYGQTLTPAQFATASLVALSFSNACAIYGFTLFLLGASAQEYTFFALGTLVVDFACILPRGLQFWTAYENRSNV